MIQRNAQLLIALGAMMFTISSTAIAACTSVDTVTKGTKDAAYVASTNETITGDVDAAGCHIGVYIPGGVKNVTVSANVHDANQYGVYNDGDASVGGSEIYNIGNHTAGVFDPNGNQTGVAVYFFDATGSVTNNNIHDYQKGGIVINGISTANVTDNEVAGRDPVGFIAQNGIQFGYGAKGNVKDNTVTGNWYTGAGWSSTGILLFETGNVTVQGNTVESNQVGIAIEAWCWFEASSVNNRVVRNTVLGADWGVSIAAYSLGGYSQCDASADNNKVTNNIIDSSADDDTGVEGVSVGTDQAWGGTDNPTADNNKVIHNTISGFATEISESGTTTSSKIHANVIAP